MGRGAAAELGKKCEGLSLHLKVQVRRRGRGSIGKALGLNGLY